MAGGFISSKERETLTLLSKDTEYASDLQTYGWKFAQKFPPKQPFRRKANRNRSTILPKTVLIPRSPPPNAIRRGGSRISGIFRKEGIHICHFAYKANAPEDYLLKIADFSVFLHPK